MARLMLQEEQNKNASCFQDDIIPFLMLATRALKQKIRNGESFFLVLEKQNKLSTGLRCELGKNYDSNSVKLFLATMIAW